MPAKGSLIDSDSKLGKRIELFAQPFLETATLLPRLESAHGLEQYLDATFTPTNSDDLPARSLELIRVVREAVQLGTRIYLKRLQHSSTSTTLSTCIERDNESVNHLKTLVTGLPPFPGDHALIWVYFVAAAETDVMENRLFLIERLVGLFNLVHAVNITTAISGLEFLWNHSEIGLDWAHYLPKMPLSLIM